jgi:hypothetical protein
VIAVLASCQLEEITIPLGQPVVVVQGVMTLDSAALAQYVVVERSLTGTVEVPDQDSLRGPPRPPVPISGALVRVSRDDELAVDFAEIPDTLGVYRLDRPDWPAGYWQAGRVYRLLVVTPEGDTVRGRTRMPDFPSVSGIPGSGATLNRDRDTLFVSWSGAAGTKGVFVQVRPRDLERRLTLVLFTDSTRFRIPGNMPLPLLDDTLPPVVWVAGTRQTFTVAAMDTAFFNFFRTGNDPFTGTGFINGVEGGLGVFGSMAPVNRTYEVRGVVDHPFEGLYQLRARVRSDSLIAGLELYVNRDRPSPVLAAALGVPTSSPLQLPFATPLLEASGRIEPAPPGAASGVDGLLHLWVISDSPNQPRYLLEGTFSTSAQASGQVRDKDGSVVGGYTLTRIQ